MTKPIVPQLTQFKPRPKSILELIKDIYKVQLKQDYDELVELLDEK